MMDAFVLNRSPVRYRSKIQYTAWMGNWEQAFSVQTRIVWPYICLSGDIHASVVYSSAYGDGNIRYHILWAKGSGITMMVIDAAISLFYLEIYVTSYFASSFA